MREARQSALEIAGLVTLGATLDLVVPFTTPGLTAAAFKAARHLGQGLNTSIRLLKIQVVPYPLDLTSSPVPPAFLREQLRGIQRGYEASCEVRFAREFEPGLEGAIAPHSVVLLATRKRPWRTRTERLASALRRAGHTVVLVREGNNTNA